MIAHESRFDDDNENDCDESLFAKERWLVDEGWKVLCREQDKFYMILHLQQ